MEKMYLNWQVGHMPGPEGYPEEMLPAAVPGAVQLDYAKAKNQPPYWEGVNFRDYRWMEDVYWLYETEMDLILAQEQAATLVFTAIDYRYRITVDGDVLAEDEGMFSPVQLDVTPYAGRSVKVQVLLWPVPKADDSDTRTQVRYSCKAAAPYTWDWHPRLVSSGLWDEAYVAITHKCRIRQLDVSYRLTDDLAHCAVDVTVPTACPAPVRVRLWDGEALAAETVTAGRSAVLELDAPRLWYPAGYGEQPIYTLTAETLDEAGRVLDSCSRRLGLRRSKLVMNEGAWREPDCFPKTRSPAPATLEINGQKVFAKGSNWVNAQVFPGTMDRAHYDALLTQVSEANMNILRIWGGGYINKESFFDLCDEKGIMVWQEFPLACNEYPDDDRYLSVLEKEATAIVRRLRTHPSVVMWCGGNELFNSWSRMTEQHHALRLLDAVCYKEDRFTPYNMTSPLNGMAHGHYLNYDDAAGTEVIRLFKEAKNTAYTEFGCPGASDPAYIRTFMREEDFADCRAENDVWLEHHAYGAWGKKTWLRTPEADYYFGGYSNVEDLCNKCAFIQAMCYRSAFEAMRHQWPHCSMALNWCLNEPWPTAANNSLINWPDRPKPSYYAVQQALRPRLASLAIDRHLWWAGERFTADVWLLNDSPEALTNGRITLKYAFGDSEPSTWGTLTAAPVAPRTNLMCGSITFSIPGDFSGKLRLIARVEGHPEMDSEYTYLCRIKEKANTQGMLNV